MRNHTKIIFFDIDGTLIDMQRKDHFRPDGICAEAAAAKRHKDLCGDRQASAFSAGFPRRPLRCLPGLQRITVLYGGCRDLPQPYPDRRCAHHHQKRSGHSPPGVHRHRRADERQWQRPGPDRLLCHLKTRGQDQRGLHAARTAGSLSDHDGLLSFRISDGHA